MGPGRRVLAQRGLSAAALQVGPSFWGQAVGEGRRWFARPADWGGGLLLVKGGWEAEPLEIEQVGE